MFLSYLFVVKLKSMGDGVNIVIIVKKVTNQQRLILPQHFTVQNPRIDQ